MKVDRNFWKHESTVEASNFGRTITIRTHLPTIVEGVTIATRGFTIERYSSYRDDLYVIRYGKRWEHRLQENFGIFAQPPFSAHILEALFREFYISRLAKPFALDMRP